MMKPKRQLSRSAFLKRIKDTVKQYDMLHKGDRVLAAVSGGADSVCLLKTLVDIRRQLGIEVIVGNLDHGLRGVESKRDSDFVKDLSGKLTLKCVHKKVNLRSTREKGRSQEEQARWQRYAFLVRAAAANDCNVIATGHTMDDQAETVLMRIICGASSAGIAGIPPIRYEKGMKIIRPLIRVPRQDILAYLKGEGLEYVVDSSNLDTKFLRNSVRREVLPFLEKYNPRLKRSLVNLSDSLREDLSFINAEKEKKVKKITNKKAGTVAVKIKDIILQSKAIRREIFKELFIKAGGNVKKLTYRHWMDMDYFLKAAEKNKSLDFPGSVRVTRRKDEVVFAKRTGGSVKR